MTTFELTYDEIRIMNNIRQAEGFECGAVSIREVCQHPGGDQALLEVLAAKGAVKIGDGYCMFTDAYFDSQGGCV